jgi:hypothetical protein
VFLELLERQVPSDGCAQVDLDLWRVCNGCQLFYQRSGPPVCWHADRQHASDHRQTFKHCDPIAEQGKNVGGTQTRRPGPDNGDPCALPAGCVLASTSCQKMLLYAKIAQVMLGSLEFIVFACHICITHHRFPLSQV